MQKVKSPIPQNSIRAVYFISLGCSKNLVDSEVMLGILEENGYKIIDNPETANVIIVNTCGFLTAAIEEGIEHILAAAEYKVSGACECLVVAGCLPQRHKEDLVSELPEVDLFIGVDEYAKIFDYLSEVSQSLSQTKLHIERTDFLLDYDTPRKSTTGIHTRYVKIAEGCNHACSFCVIPKIRGRLKSRTLDSVYQEISQLTNQGAKEITLIAQDLTLFGVDRGADQGLLELLAKLESLPTFWLRLLYNYPENITEGFAGFMAKAKNVVPYIDMPVQHASDRILKLMRRPLNQTQLREKIQMLRQYVPDISIRTSIIVGFPGETEADFQHLHDFVSQVAFEHLGVFAYSHEIGAFSTTLPDQISEEVKQERLAAIMTLQQQIAFAKNEKKVGQIFSGLLLGNSSESDLLLEARLKSQAPEVDGVVLINDGTAKFGDFVKIEVTETAGYDLVGKIV